MSLKVSHRKFELTWKFLKSWFPMKGQKKRTLKTIKNPIPKFT